MRRDATRKRQIVPHPASTTEKDPDREQKSAD
jgi:hypothetical protein